MSLPKKDSEHLSEKTLELVGLGDNKMHQYPSQMSGGEQQRVSIARALVKNAEIILCDEPTGALDDKTGRKILELLQNIVREQGQTMVIVTHTTPIASMANRVITLRDGKIQKEVVNQHPVDAKDIVW
jgi:putative ABC transport system ATP-binding protein